MISDSLYNRILALLRREVKPALGCTEPIAVALSVARAASLGKDVQKVRVSVSANILKNAMGVGIPGTGQVGLPVAAALAVEGGKWELGLELFRDIDSKAVEMAREFVARSRVEVKMADTGKLLYSCAECYFANGSRGCCIIEDAHDSIVFLSLDDNILFDRRQTSDNVPESSPVQDEPEGDFLSLELIYEFAKTCRLEDLDLMREQVRLNTALSEEGLKGNYGLNVGRTLVADVNREVFGNDLCTRCMSMTAAASDARMSGCILPAMSNSGSGNQGITVSLPVVAAARHLKCSEEELLRALVLSNLVAIHIKSYLGKLSALCGCVVASTGSACGIVLLRGGSAQQMGWAVKNMIGSITGMICDGAKEGCAMKVASGVSCALQSAVLALDGICVPESDGIIDKDVEKTIRNLGRIGSRGMKSTDSMILDIMLCK